jgi:hypothetical protein
VDVRRDGHILEVTITDLLWSASGKPMCAPEKGFAGLTSRWCAFGLRLADTERPRLT